MNYFDRNKWWAIAFILLVALNIATLSTFWLMKEKRAPATGPRPAVTEFLVKELGLDSLQKKELEKLREEHQQKVMDIRKNNRDAKDAFFALLKQPGITDSAVDKAAQTAALYDAQLDILTFRHFRQIRNICTDAQKKKFDQVIQEVLRMIAPPPGKPQGPPMRGDRPPPPSDGHEPPPPPEQ
jgi:protein CpxP